MGLLSLIAKIGADTTGYERGMKKVQDIAKETAMDVGQHLKGTLGGFFSAAAAEEAVRRTIEYVTHVKDLSEQFRMSTDQVQQLDAASKKVGLNFEDWERVLSKGFDPFAPGAAEKLEDAGPRAYKLKAALEELHNLGPIPLISKEDIENIDKADKLLGQIASRGRAGLAGIIADYARLTSGNVKETGAGVAGLISNMVSLTGLPGSGPVALALKALQNALKGPASGGPDDEVNPINGIPYDERYATNPEGISKTKRIREANISSPNLLVDDLARIGGFSGGADRGVSSLLQQQLAVQVKIERNTKEEVDA